MLTPYVLTTVTAPRQRLGISEPAMIIPVMATGCMYFLIGGLLMTCLTWFIAHMAMVVVCYLEPHYMYLRRGRRYPKTARRVDGRGAVYGA